MTDNPFVGPDPLGDHDLLFGRERDLRRVRNLLIAERVVLLHAPSGAGKSSFVQAGLAMDNSSHHGLLKELQLSGFRPLPVTRANRNPRAREVGLGAEINRYSWSIRRRLLGSVAPSGFTDPSDPAIQNLNDFLKKACPETSPQQTALGDGSTDDDQIEQPDYQAWVLVIDQFEEVLTEDLTDSDAKKQFFKELGDAMRERRNIWFLLVMREESAAALTPYLRYLPRRIPSRYHLGMLSTKAARKVIEQIDRSTGAPRFRTDGIDEMVRDLASIQVEIGGGQSAPRARDFIEPMHMQIECRDLWNHHPEPQSIGATEARGHGDLKHSLMRYYDEQLAAMTLGLDERQVREWLDKNLILRGLYRFQVPREADSTLGLSNVLVDALIKKHILREENREGHPWLELAHDRLVAAVHDANDAWYQLNLGRFQQFARQWNQNKQPPEDLILGHRLQELKKRWENLPLEAYEREFLMRSEAMEAEQENTRRAAQQQQEREALKQQRKELEQQKRINNFKQMLDDLEKKTTEEQEAARRGRMKWIVGALIILVFIAFGLLHWQQRESTILQNTVEMLETERMTVLDATIKARGARDEAQKAREEADRLRQEQASIALTYGTATRLNSGSYKLLDEAPGNGELPALLARQAAQVARHGEVLDRRLASVADSALRRVFSRTAFGRQIHAPNWQVDRTIADHAGRACLLITGDANVDEVAVDFLDGAPPKTFKRPPGDGTPRAVAVSRERKLVAVASDTGVSVWPLGESSGQEPLLNSVLPGITLLAFAPDGHTLAALASTGTIYLYAVDKPGPPREFPSTGETWSDIAFGPDSATLVAGSTDGTLAILRLGNPDAAPRILDLATNGIAYRLHSLAVTPDSQHVVAAVTALSNTGDIGQLLMVPLTQNTDALIRRIAAPSGKTGAAARIWHRIALSADGRRLATGAVDGTIGLWELPPAALHEGRTTIDAKELRLFSAQAQPIRALRFIESDNSLMSVDARAATYRWTPLQPWDEPTVRLTQEGSVSTLTFNPASGLLIAAGEQERLRAWNPALGYAPATPSLRPSESDINSLAIARDSRTVVLGYASGNIELIRRNSGTDQSYRRQQDASPIARVAISPNGTRFATASSDGSLLVWDASTFVADPQGYQPMQLFPRAVNTRLAFAFSSDGRYFAVAGRSMPLQVWDLDQPVSDPRHVAAPDDGKDLSNALQVLTMAFSADDHYLASAWQDGSIRVQDWRSNDPSRAQLNTNGLPIDALAFAPDGDLFTGYRNGTLLKWSLTGEFEDPLVLRGFGQPIDSLAVSSSGDAVAVANSNGTIAIWRLVDTADLAEGACRLVTRNLSQQEWTQYVGNNIPYQCSCPDYPPGTGVPDDACTRKSDTPSAVR